MTKLLFNVLVLSTSRGPVKITAKKKKPKQYYYLEAFLIYIYLSIRVMLCEQISVDFMKFTTSITEEMIKVDNTMTLPVIEYDVQYKHSV